MRNHIKVLAVILIMTLFAGIMYYPSAKVEAGSAPKEFSDVKLAPSSDGYKAIYWAVDKGVTTGIKNTDKFGPEDACTRSQAVTFIWRLAGKPNPESKESEFSDIDAKFKKERSDMYKAVLWATEKKIVAGYSDGTFRPNTKCTRAHIVTFLYRFAGKPDQKKYSSAKSPFTDVKTSIGKDMYPAIMWAKDKGVTTGISGTKKFDPKGTCTRKQIVTFLWRYDGKNGAAPTATPAPDPTAVPTVTSVPEPTAKPTEIPVATATPVATPTTSSNAKDTTPYKKITLDGVKDHHFIADDYCYIESEKYILFLEKDIDVPGDLTVNLDAIVDEIESTLGISHDAEGFVCNFGNIGYAHYGDYQPWEGWDIGSKIPVMLFVDRDDSGYISCATADETIIHMKELISMDYWNSVPSYKNDPSRRRDYIDYDTFAHEMTHTITWRYRNWTEILSEGIAEYTGTTVVKKLADKYPSIGEVVDKKDLDDVDGVPEVVNASNAERIFIEDYHQIDHAHRGAQYTYGRWLFNFLHDEYGSDFYKKFTNKAVSNKNDCDPGEYSEAKVEGYADTLKEVFGDDVFTKFGNWCVEKNVMQSAVHFED